MFSITSSNNKIVTTGKTDLGAFKIVCCTDEMALIEDLNKSLISIEEKNRSKPLLYTFYANYYISNIVLRMLRFNLDGRTTPSKKYAIIDLKASLGNYNNLSECLDYTGILKREERLFDSTEIMNSLSVKDKDYAKKFLKYACDKISGLAELTRRYKRVTYDNEFRQPVVVDIETHAEMSLKDQFIIDHPRYKDESDEELNKLMARNPMYNRFYSYSMCLLNE